MGVTAGYRLDDAESPVAGAGLTFERSDHFRRYPAAVESPRLGFHAFPTETAIDTPGVKREISLDNLEARSGSFIAPGNRFARVLRESPVGRRPLPLTVSAVTRWLEGGEIDVVPGNIEGRWAGRFHHLVGARRPCQDRAAVAHFEKTPVPPDGRRPRIVPHRLLAGAGLDREIRTSVQRTGNRCPNVLLPVAAGGHRGPTGADQGCTPGQAL
jgi:hypothetical protein